MSDAGGQCVIDGLILVESKADLPHLVSAGGAGR
jgi:hypothetical protein